MWLPPMVLILFYTSLVGEGKTVTVFLKNLSLKNRFTSNQLDFYSQKNLKIWRQLFEEKCLSFEICLGYNALKTGSLKMTSLPKKIN